MKLQFTEEQARKILSLVCLNTDIDKKVTVAIDSTLYNLKQCNYIIPVKSEEPLIVHNVMSYKGKDEPSKERFVDCTKEEEEATSKMIKDKSIVIKKNVIPKSKDDEEFDLGEPDYIGDLMQKGENKMFKKLFCDHSYNIIKEVNLPSEIDMIREHGMKPLTTHSTVRKIVIISKCEKCNKIKHKEYKTED